MSILFAIIAIYLLWMGYNKSVVMKPEFKTTARITDIEQTVEITEENGKTTLFWLILELPPFKGVPLGKKYDKPIDPKRYTVGEMIEIYQNPEQPTEVIIPGEIDTFNHPSTLLTIGFVMIILSFSMCYLHI